MREIKVETPRVEISYLYEAADGTRFNDQEECRKYENSAMGVVKSKIKSLVVEEGLDAWELMGGYDDHSVTAVKLTKPAHADLLKQFMLLLHPYYNDDTHKHVRDKVFNTIDCAYRNKDILLLGVNCDGEYYFINSRGNIVDNLNNIGKEKDNA